MIREIPEHAETPIIFLTTEGTIDNITVALQLGACDFLVKPINGEILYEKLANWLKGYQIRRRIRSFERL